MKKEPVEMFYDNISSDYNTTHNDRFVDSIFEYFLKQHINGDNLKILDAGGGVGRFSIDYAKLGHQVILTDISKGMVDRARIIAEKMQLKNISFFHESVTNMHNQNNDTFDIVLLMNGVLDYCDDYNKALHEVLRVLKKGGLVIGTVNNKFLYATTNILLVDKNVEAFRDSFKTGNYNKSFPIHDFSLHELENALIRSKFGIIEIVGPTNLLRKWEYAQLVTKENKQQVLNLQLELSRNKDYINNSTDFLFVAKKL